VDTYTSSLVKGTASNLSQSRTALSGGNIGNYALFAGGGTGVGSSSTKYSDVDTFSSTLVKGTATKLSAGRVKILSIRLTNLLLFANGGYDSYAIDTYDGNLVKGLFNSVNMRDQGAGIGIGNYAIIAGGVHNSPTNVYQYVE
jgi:hypothetical protein